MSFNLAKIADLTGVPSAATELAEDAATDVKNQFDLERNQTTGLEAPPLKPEQDIEINPTVDIVARNLAAKQAWELMQGQMEALGRPMALGRLMAEEDYQNLAQQVMSFNPESYDLDDSQLAQALASSETKMSEFAPLIRRFNDAAKQIQDTEQSRQDWRMTQPEPTEKLFFNLRQTKKAQTERPNEVDAFDKAEFVAQYLDRLIRYDGRKGENDAVSMKARQEINAMASPVLENDINDAIESIQGLDDRQQAERFLEQVYENFIAPKARECDEPDMEQPVMSDKSPKGIIKHNLSDHVLNNKKASMEKTAADQFGQSYMLYGPTEKRICPKLRGKNMGDFVSEYICRHHCLDGIVIDDNKTICGEALWRANAMDKYSREYVDADGNIQGGYINKRFEINRNVPEENKMRLKPGETRKPRPPEWGNLESRMQAMRNKEGKERGYAPDTDTSKPFQWCTDVDQNNVEPKQAERDRREESSGHQTVEYTNKTQTENNPKKTAFNLKEAKKRWMQDAADRMEEKGTVGDFTEWCGGNVTDDCIERGLAEGGHRAQQANFARNARKAKKSEAQSAPFDVKEGGYKILPPIPEEEFPRRPMDQSDTLEGPFRMENGRIVYYDTREGKYYDIKRDMYLTEDEVSQMHGWKPLASPNPPDDGRPIEPIDQPLRSAFNLKRTVEAKSPPGFKHTVEHMKEHHSDEIDEPFALAWWMKNKGYKSHKGPHNVHECDDDKDEKKDKKKDKDEKKDDKSKKKS
jgi:hypothetical protein